MCNKKKDEKAHVEEQNSKKRIKTNVHPCSERELPVVKYCCMSCFTCPIDSEEAQSSNRSDIDKQQIPDILLGLTGIACYKSLM